MTKKGDMTEYLEYICGECEHKKSRESATLPGSNAMSVEIVSNSGRYTVENEEFYYLYIPLTNRECCRFATTTINACFRIKINKH